MVQLALSAGARQGEILNLRWPQVDLKSGRIVLHHRDRRVLHLCGPAAWELTRLAKA
ncbi:MAG: hypothetical protein DWQ09_07340 [Proteobacteria bacterium]|nr:MAG: hypothetical protein DWQ09_07340 [Pseudomonadota bacterium]